MILQRIEAAHPKVLLIEMGHFNEGRGYSNWREHGTTDWLLIATLAGQGRFGFGGGAWITQPGDITLYRPGTPHDYGVTANRPHWELLWAHFHPRPHWHEWLDWPEVAPGLLNLNLRNTAGHEAIIGCLGQALNFTKGAQPRREAFAMNALELAVLLCDAENPQTRGAKFDRRVQQAMDYLCLHAAEVIPLDTLATHCGLSVSRLSHLFREQVGMTPGQYLELQRLERARQLLELTSRPIQTIASETGFENPFYFSSRFKRLTGYSPRDYRKERTKNPPVL